MGFLNPLFLLAGTAVLVPVFLHLFYRRESKTFTFPAIRYLLQTERERARQIRTQQLLLLLLRCAIVVLIVLMGARVYAPGPGASHEPTALALVIDNSMSATIIEDGRRCLDALKDVARQSVARSGPDDRIWVIRAGTPWEAAAPGGGAQALVAIDETQPAHTRGDLVLAVARARALVGQSDRSAAEVHLFTDLQATAFKGPGQLDARPGAAVPTQLAALPWQPEPAGDGNNPDREIPLVVFGAPVQETANAGVDGVVVGGGLPPLAGRRTDVAAALSGGAPGDTMSVRLYIGGQVRGAATAPAGATVRIPAGPFPAGRVEGWVEIDPDPLTADDRYYFAVTARDPTPVALLGDAPFFVTEALAVLADEERISLESASRAATLVSAGGEGLEARSPDQAAFVFPLSDATRLPALNRRLAAAGIPFRYARSDGGETRVAASELPIQIGGLTVVRHFRVERTDGAREAPEDSGSPEEVAASLSSGDPWLLAGESRSGPYVLLASPLNEESSRLPVSAAMVPLLEWAIDRWTGDGTAHSSVTAGDPVRPPPTATAIRDPGGTLHSVDGDQPFPATAMTGFYQALAADSVAETIAVNAPEDETDLAPASEAEIRQALPDVAAVVGSASSWPRHIFRAGRGPEPWPLFALLLLALLVVESGAAASSKIFSRSGRQPSGDPS